MSNEITPSAVILLGADKTGKLKINKHALSYLHSCKWVIEIEIHAEDGQTVAPFIDGRQCLASIFIQSKDTLALVKYENEIRQSSLFSIY